MGSLQFIVLFTFISIFNGLIPKQKLKEIPPISITTDTVKNTKNIVISTDNSAGARALGFIPLEHDDGLALAVLLKAHKEGKLNVLGIASTFGNTDGQTTYSVTKKLVDLSGLPIPVWKGADYAGQKESEAVTKLTELLKNSKDKVGLLALGPVTDYAALFNKHPELINKVAYFLLIRSGPYKTKDYWFLDSFNAVMDASSAYTMYNFGGNQFAMGKEIFNMTLSDSEINQIQKVNHPMVSFISKDLKRWNLGNRLLLRRDMIPWDLVWVMYVTNPELYIVDKIDNHFVLHVKDKNKFMEQFINDLQKWNSRI